MRSTPFVHMSSSTAAQAPSSAILLVAVSSVVLITMVVVIVVVCNRIVTQKGRGAISPDSRLLTLTMDKYLNHEERENPIKFTSQQVKMATQNFTTKLGSGGFGAVYKGAFSNGTMVAVKVLHASSHKRMEEQFIAEVSTIGRVHHPHLVKLYGYCFEKELRALVYEYMEKGSLDKLLFHGEEKLGLERLNEIAIGTAKGIAYLHEECHQLIVHYDIKPGNILLDASFSPKVADFGLAKLCSREKAHVLVTGGRGTPGYAAPELWVPVPVTHKCDVYSFGMLLFEIMGRRRNLDVSLPSSQEWFPKWVWSKYASRQVGELMDVCGVEATDRGVAERMAKVALWCVQYTPQSRPLMSHVVKMLEGQVEIEAPLDPFEDMGADRNFPGLPGHATWPSSSLGSGLFFPPSNSLP